ncbi:MAG: hypothetical protein GOMPHAMPRED_004010 [Gomphillus americanus]|uniref:Glucose-methanol-choline oxidoreductase N-terminal domain-containing protein n=1 Tax=Gomphillus americanus TaxID=1940652 RepID=A0A8H3FH84_9LECA|nr:MAG: hypothetical protein GOMPHAMPRED_004010 [Gomphillus americanus]
MKVALFVAWFATVLAAPPSQGSTALQYEYIVVGSGAGGGPLACRLAQAGHKTLLIEAGDDESKNLNTTVPAFQALVADDPNIAWHFFVNHYQDQTRAQRDPKYVYETAPYQYHVGANPPAGAKPLGIEYPRANTLGGCVTHNALIWVTPHASDWNNIASITGDNTWSADNMNQYLDKVYEWQPIGPTDPTILVSDLMFTQHVLGGAAVMGVGPTPVNALTGMLQILAEDPNNRINPNRDSTEGYFQVPLTQQGGQRTNIRDHILNTVAEGYPLTIRTNCHVTKIDFNGKTATGVSFLDGKHLYRASPKSGGTGTPGSATASKEVIISGGAYNTPQLLKLSGIGPAAELKNFGIKVISDLPGVGTNLQDRYETFVNVEHPNNFPILNGCTFQNFDGTGSDACLTQWQNNPNILAQRGAYATNGVASMMGVRSKYADTRDLDLFIFSGPVDFTGYFPGWGKATVQNHNFFSWYSLKAHTRNRAGTVQLKSADPLDTPVINFNYFDTGTTTNGADQKDLNSLVQAINMSRQALKAYNDYFILGGTSFVETKPGPSVQSQAELEQFVKDTTWGHHASCSCPIGADNDPNAVLDSKFRVRGVKNLRVVDASAFPVIPGVFIQSPIVMLSEKAANTILNG